MGLAPVPAYSQASSFTIVNETGLGMREISIRRFGGREWRPLGLSAPPGGQVAVPFSSPDCAFDLRAELSGGSTAIWSGVNLCEAKLIRLNREPSGELWVDYN